MLNIVAVFIFTCSFYVYKLMYKWYALKSDVRFLCVCVSTHTHTYSSESAYPLTSFP